MFDPQSDPLGLGLQARARAQRQSQMTNNPAAQAYMSGPLVDPNMDAWFQAQQEAAGGKPTKFAAGPSAPGSNQLTGLPQGGNPMIGLNDYFSSQKPSTPGVQQPGVQMGAMQGLQHAGPSNEQELRQRRARMLNQEQPAANFTPNAGGYNPHPGS